MYPTKVLIIYILIIVFLFVFLEKKAQPSSTIEETKAMEKVFSDYLACLFCRDDFGYALIGAKPMSFTVDFLPTPLMLYLSSFLHTPHNSVNFLFRIWREKNGTATIVFVNKKLFRKVYNEHLADFQKILGTVSADDFLHQIATSEKSFFDIIHHNEIILGTLLGFGKGNASLFARWRELFRGKYSIFYKPDIYFPKRHHPLSIELPKALIPSPPFKTLAEERAWFNQYFNKAIDHYTPFCAVDLVWAIGFRVTDSEETTQLVTRYTKAKEILTKLFTERDCLDVVEEQLQATHPLTFDEINESL